MSSEKGLSAYILGALVAGGASYAMGNAWWLVLLHATLSWLYVLWTCI